MIDPDVALLETIEAETAWDFQVYTPSDAVLRYGMTWARIGGGVALAVRDDTTGRGSRALGFGATEPVTGELVDSLIDFYRANGNSRATLQFAPSALPPDWDKIRARHGLTAGATHLKLSRSAGPVTPATTGLRIAEVEVERAELWASVMVRGFSMPAEQLVPSVQNVAARPGWTMFAAFEGDRMVAAAGLLIRGGIAEMTGASTLPGYRRQGAQSALLAARIQKAAAGGASLLSAETTKTEEGSRSISLNNLLRAGFEIRYERLDWNWRSQPS
ncbi:GNAT family N-acetyltransferase [Kribbella sandramycini]|uniref:GNAT family N-acetyltransferase n=1 Tax=Kribbella sandramycini TaxID=60450 RepID=A0A7Y4KVU2_9ACTN|nr:GNAT family N-acetyltransferase [Kribbella sandramycini]MBB6567744.1 GNAT superfamily N-acetyltransferase [Kribbella sandramycini]NOL39660.1 GNAT family N-acetyltransferase [Kribbella sandramycini]